MENENISIVIPCLNEEKTIGMVVQTARESLRKMAYSGEVVVSDNGSSDASIAEAERCGARVVHCPRKGYGSALQHGFREAKGQYIIFGDADGSYDFSQADKFVRELRKGHDMVIGSRLKGKIERGSMPFLHRYVGTPILSWFLNVFFRMHISDCNCGMRGLSRRAFETMKLRSPGMEFASEMVIKAGVLKMKIKEVPIMFYKDKRNRPPHLNTWRDGWRHLRLILIYAPNYLFIYPGTVFFLLGAFLLLIQASGPVTFGPVHMDLHFMILGLTLSLLGISIIQMGMIVKLFSYQNDYYGADFFVRQMKKISLEKKILFGIALFLFGLGIDLKIFFDWVSIDFSNPEMFRPAIFGLYFVIIGVSMILFSFLEAVMSNNEN